MARKGPATKGMWRTKEMERALLRCADCGLIRGTHDHATLVAFHSVLIEKPGVAKYLCACPDADN